MDVIGRSPSSGSPGSPPRATGSSCSRRRRQLGERRRPRRRRRRRRGPGFGLGGGSWPGRRASGPDPRLEPDIVLNAIVGSAGLGPTIATLSEGIELALANKESLVVGGELVMRWPRRRRADHPGGLRALGAASSWSPRSRPGVVDRLVLTASGGPFRGRTELDGVTLEEALAHPTWAMGGKITIDSATLMNKGLELIEAHHLFGVPYERIDVVVHPQSMIHSPDPAQRRRHPGAPRATRTCACRSPTRCTPRARRRARRAARPRRGRRARLRGARRRDLPCLRLAARPARPAARRPVCSTRPTRWRCTPSSTASSRSPGSPALIERVLELVPAPRRSLRAICSSATARPASAPGRVTGRAVGNGGSTR